MTLPSSPWGTLRRRVAHLAGLLAEDRAEQALLGRELGLALGRDLADEHVAGADLGADADDAALVEVLQDLLGQVRDVARDLFGTELGVAGVDLVLVDVDRREHVVLHEPLAQDDRVLEVVALPRHERDEQVLAERELAVIGRRAVGEDVALLDLVALAHQRLLVDARVLVRPLELEQPVDACLPALSYSTMMWSPSTSVTVPSSSAMIMSAASRAARASMPVPMYGASAFTSGTAWRCMLAPMSARLASSCSRNGMSAVATDTICFGDTSISWTSSGGTDEISVVAPKKMSRSSCS